MKKPYILSIVNQKGGVGKTTTAINLSHKLSKKGKKTLLIDFDPQSNVSDWLGIDLSPTTLQIMNALLFDDLFAPPVQDINQLIQSKFGFDIIPTKRPLTQADNLSRSMVGRERLLKNSIQQIQGIDKYDIVIIDCPPAPGFLNNTAFFASDGLLVTVQAEYLALNAFKTVIETIDKLKKEYANDFSGYIFGILPTMSDDRLNLTKNTKYILNKRFPNKIFSTSIRRNVYLAESPGHKKPIGEYKPKSYGDEDYSKLADEVIERL